MLFIVVLLDLPKLNSFILGTYCFYSTKNLTIYSIFNIFISYLIDVPFEDGYYDVADYGPEIISFHDLTVDGIISDSSIIHIIFNIF